MHFDSVFQIRSALKEEATSVKPGSFFTVTPDMRAVTIRFATYPADGGMADQRFDHTERGAFSIRLRRGPPMALARPWPGSPRGDLAAGRQ